MKKIIFLSIVSILLIEARGFQNGFNRLDINSDGKIEQSEFYDAKAKRMTERANEGRKLKNAGLSPNFEDIDMNKDNIITEKEFQEYKMTKRRGKGRRNKN